MALRQHSGEAYPVCGYGPRSEWRVVGIGRKLGGKRPSLLMLVLLMLPLIVLPSCGGGGTTSSAPPPPISVAISPTSRTMFPSGVQQFTATVTNTANTQVNW